MCPQTKVRMINALHHRKCFVSMTGDGVNDSPGLKQSGIGIVMGLAMSALYLASFVLILYEFGLGKADIGENYNNEYSEDCKVIFRARATTFACLTWLALFLAWEMVNMRPSLFRMQFTQWMHDVWRNQFLFWAIVAGFVTMCL
ncbi:hypothetical protein NCS57_01480000 [Fusarium keratoplasticum]|uniref:Uncharacterized protein n=1 Tax=Fusarium keratoplasticum TaxID=1328300 RepID=A0ACC0QCA7_9HYPO|nr:hypothetical protein NCS57_01480000 [Fusarium keratoplasticum]KAI8648679.1 hypothetical protein NCS57_01480000 [Fusarium keratoplasticum]